MRRTLSSFLQSYSPFLGSGGDNLLLGEPLLDHRTSVGVQTLPAEDPQLTPSSTAVGLKRSVVAPTAESGVDVDDRCGEDGSAEDVDKLSGSADHTPSTVGDEEENSDHDMPTPTHIELPLTPMPKDSGPASPREPATHLSPTAEAVAPSDIELQSRGPQRDEELWFEDGNLVLYAGDVEFRVYKGPFMAQSAFFKDMLSLPQPSSPVSDGDGNSHPAGAGTPSCAVVHLTDSPQDVRHFLRSFIEAGIKYEPTFDEVSAYIRLGHKYQCEKMVARALAYLRQYYVSDFDRWFAVTSLDPPAFRAIHRIGVVNLARLTRADDLLPVALMCCCMLGPELGDGFAREDGTHEALSRADLARCFVGRARLLEAAFVAAHRTFRAPVADGCAQPERCARALQRLLERMVEHAGLMKDIRDLRIDSSKSAYISETDEERALCRRCVTMVGKHGRGAEHHRDIFTRLPEIMGVVVEDWMKPRGAEQDTDDATTT